ncbi:MAG TPA: methyltransferase domain-containing protein [Balneolaceae bacterium]
MEISYWQSRWRKNKTGWHLNEVYLLLPDLWPSLSLKAGARILVPFCGKSLDMQWFTDHGFHVTGVDVSEKALQEFMERSRKSFSSYQEHGLSVFRSKNIELWQGNFQKLPINNMAPFDAIYDKAALIALPRKMRAKYAQKALQLCDPATQMLLQTFEYGQDEMAGPPFSVDEDELQKLYGKQFDLALLYQKQKPELLEKFQRRGLLSYLIEKVYHLKPKK